MRRIAVAPYRPAGSSKLAEAVAGRLAEADVMMLAHHGCLAMAPDADVAFEAVATLEAAATATYHALLLGDANTVCPPEYLARVEAREAAGGAPAANGA